jgi:hypothetical protein
MQARIAVFFMHIPHHSIYWVTSDGSRSVDVSHTGGGEVFFNLMSLLMKKDLTAKIGGVRDGCIKAD